MPSPIVLRRFLKEEYQIPFSDVHLDRLTKAGFRAELDESNEKLGYKIRHWKTQKKQDEEM